LSSSPSSLSLPAPKNVVAVLAAQQVIAAVALDAVVTLEALVVAGTPRGVGRVEAHLTRIARKLGIRGRSELARLVTERRIG
jgi:hypothetical protein